MWMLAKLSSPRRVRTSLLPVMAVVCLALNSILTVGARHDYARDPSTESPSQSESPQPLTVGGSMLRNITGGAVQYFKIQATAGQYFRTAVELNGIILRVSLVDPSGNRIVEMNNPAGGYGTIYLSEIGSTTGEYKLEVRSTEAWSNPGSFKITLENLRASTPSDVERVAAEGSFAKAIKDDDARSFKSAIDGFTKSQSYWKQINDRHWEALTWFALGQTYRRSGDLRNEERCFNEALKIELDESDWRLKASIINDLGFNRALGGDSQKAITLLNESLRLFEAHNDRRGQASSLNNLAITYARIGEFRKALELTERALPLRRAENFQSGVNNLLNTIGNIYDRLGDPYKSLENFTQALEGWQKLAAEKQLDSPDRLGNGLNSMALASERVGNPAQAGQYYQQALSVEGITKPLRAAILNNRGALYASLGDSDTALQYLTEAETLLGSLEQPDRDVKASVLLQIGQTQITKGNFQDGLGYLQRARDSKPNNPKLAYILTALGDAWSRQGKLDEALKAFEEALGIQVKIEDLRGQAVTRQKRGQVYRASGNSSGALAEFESALSLWRNVKDRFGEAATLNDVAILERDRKNLEVALQKSNEAIGVFEALRTNISSYQLRTSYFASRSNYYELNIDLNMLLSQRDSTKPYVTAAVEGSERSHARTLIDTLSESRTELQGPQIDLERDVAQRLRRKLEAQTALLNTKYRQSEADAISKEVADLIRQQDEIRGRIRARNSKYAHLTQHAQFSFADLQRQLSDDTVLLEYSLGENRSYVWVVTPDSIKGFQLEPRDKIEPVANRLVKALTARNRQVAGETPQQGKAREDKADKDYAETAQQLSKMVIEPVASLLGRKRLVIVADGALQYVPFSALPISEPTPQGTNSPTTTTAASAPTTLITNHELVSLPSASVLALQRRELANRKAAPLKLAVLADPVFDLEDSRVATELAKPNRNRKGSNATASIAQTPSKNIPAQNENSTLVSALRDVGLNPDGTLRRLSHSRTEAADISRHVPAKESLKALDFDASRATALSGELSKYQYIHFATHGILSLEHPELSGIALSMVDKKGQKQDGYLRLYEIYNLDLPAELVVLSACETGVGKQIRGEGLIALTRGFMYAGAKRVVASLWKVDDSATAELMAQFYKEMFVNKKRPPEALKEAQLSISKQRRWRSPYFWAGFVLQGEWR